jgi:hypothetical protein
MQILLLGPVTVVLGAQPVANLVEQTRFGIHAV